MEYDEKDTRGIKVAGKSKDKLKNDIGRMLVDMYKSILDFAEVSVGDKTRYDSLRKKILRAANDAKRDIERELDLYYTVTYNANKEDIIQIGAPDKRTKY